MPGIILFTVIVVVIVIVLLFLQDSKRSGAQSPTKKASDRQPADEQPAEDPLEAVDVEALAEHVKGLRRAVDQGLIGRDEAVASIVRQADGRVGEGLAERLLDSAELD